MGNNDFRETNFLDALDHYTDAIEACPYGDTYGPSGREILELRDKFDEGHRERILERQQKEMESRRKTRRSTNDADGSEDKEDEKVEEKEEEDKIHDIFNPPRHVFGPKLAVYHANRAACFLHLGRYNETITDCDIALLLNPTYIKAYLRRCTAHERTDNTEDALKDAIKAYELDPSNPIAKKQMTRLQQIENERMEKLKEETLGKLKDLGNSILGNFGLSLDNFNAVQDPNTGSYSISFDQNANKK